LISCKGILFFLKPYWVFHVMVPNPEREIKETSPGLNSNEVALPPLFFTLLLEAFSSLESLVSFVREKCPSGAPFGRGLVFSKCKHPIVLFPTLGEQRDVPFGFPGRFTHNLVVFFQRQCVHPPPVTQIFNHRLGSLPG